MNEMSGKYGAVSIVKPVGGTAAILSTIGKWQASQAYGTTSFAASNTKGAHAKRKGIVDWTGSFEQLTGSPSVMPNDVFTFNGFAGPISGVPGTVGPTLTGDAIAESIALAWDWIGNGLLKTVVNMACVTPLRNVAAGTSIHDVSTVNGMPTAGTHIDIKNTSTAAVAFTTLCAQKATLNILGNPISLVNSCSLGKGTETPPIPLGLAYQTRRAGIVGWNMTITADNSDASYTAPPGTGLPFAPGDYIEIKAYIDGSTFWNLKYGFVAGYSNYTVDIETGAIITYDIDIQGSSDSGPGQATDGAVLLPGGSAWWPAAGALLAATPEETRELVGHK